MTFHANNFVAERGLSITLCEGAREIERTDDFYSLADAAQFVASRTTSPGFRWTISIWQWCDAQGLLPFEIDSVEYDTIHRGVFGKSLQ